MTVGSSPELVPQTVPWMELDGTQSDQSRRPEAFRKARDCSHFRSPCLVIRSSTPQSQTNGVIDRRAPKEFLCEIFRHLRLTTIPASTLNRFANYSSTISHRQKSTRNLQRVCHWKSKMRLQGDQVKAARLRSRSR